LTNGFLNFMEDLVRIFCWYIFITLARFK
jgi:hypothetical protein